MDPALRTAAISGALGVVGAEAGKMLAHDDMDYAGEELKKIHGDLEALPPQVAQAVLGTVGSTMSPGDRRLVMAALSGASPAEVLAAAPGAPKELKTLIKNAGELAAGAPQVAAKAVEFGNRMNAFEEQAQSRNLAPAAVGEAVASGEAGVSPLPAILGAAGLGTGGAILSHLMSRRAAAAS